jgi:hypothetical protein
MRFALIFFALVLPTLAQENGTKAAALSACGPDEVKFDVKPDQPRALSKPSAGKALVYVIEGTAQGLDWVTIRIGLDGSWVGANHGNTHFSFSIQPGEHHLCSNWQSRVKSFSSLYSLASFTAEAGKVYYFRTRVRQSDKTSAYLDLDPLDNDEGRYLVAASTLVVSSPKK